ncbi:MAG: DUF3450 domain-containing protein [Deltaproteobacteria bacterium]|nr:DUF3450 domain-containing protein [Candidatus Anaeroferrophillacea bacterium]
MRIPLHLFLCLFCLAMVLPPAVVRAATVPVDAAGDTVNRTVAEQEKRQREVSAWEEERRELLETRHELEQRLELLRFRCAKYEGYTDRRRQTIAELEAGIAAQRQIADELEPLLDETLAKTRMFAAADLPFLVDERENRFLQIAELLDSYDASLAEKLRRVLEMLHIEARYGQGVEAYDARLPVGGGEAAVKVLRVGRVGLYYLTLDGTAAGWYNPAAGVWEPLSGGSRDAVREALRMAMKQRAVDLVTLPVAAGGRP